MQDTIEHTLLRPDATEAEVASAARMVVEHGLFGLCVAGRWVKLARHLLDDRATLVTVVAFPHGHADPEAKAHQTRRAVADGADEVDMVVDLGAIREGAARRLGRDVDAVVRAAAGRPVKAIIETSLWSERQKVFAAAVAASAGARFVKTSTGFGPGGATVDDVRLLRQLLGPEVDIKASGGIRDADFARALLASGATRLGTSRGPELVGAA